MKICPRFFCVLLSVFLLLRVEAQQLLSPPQIDFVSINAGFFDRPVDIVNAGDERLFIVEQRGVISTPFMDIQGRVNDFFNEQGLLGLAFSPDYATDGKFYVNYTEASGDTYIARFAVSADPNVADPSSEELVLEMDQPYTNHNGGCLRFGPDGYLYIGMGDGGSFGDPGNRAQNPLNLLGKTLRLDVAGAVTYTIPADNPFAGSTDTLPEIWHLGVRNPWKFAFDSENGDLFMGDVGQNDWEEVNIQLGTSTGGENYGWRCYEGNDNYNISGCSGPSLYDGPVFVYDHSSGGFSVTGGEVYRGTGYHAMQGHYLFTDYVTGNDWTTRAGTECETEQWVTQATPGSGQSDISSYGLDIFGEMYAANLANGRIYRVVEDCSANPIPELNWELVDIIYHGNTPEVIGATYQWFSDCGAIVGETMNILENTSGLGEVYVVVDYADGCSFSSSSSVVPEVGVGLNINEFESFSLSPNPTTDRIIISFINSELEEITLKLYDA
ncbi:MAG: hypothetical protein ACI959_001812, partial [Limisphaerales bacterium]